MGMLAVSKMGEQLFIYENGVPVSLGDDPVPAGRIGSLCHAAASFTGKGSGSIRQPHPA